MRRFCSRPHLLAALAALVLVVGVAAPIAASAQTVAPVGSRPATAPPPIPPAKAWVLVDVDTGNVIDAFNDHQPLPPASLTKVLTALTATETIPADASVPVSARAAAAPADKMFMKQGQVWTFDQMIHALLISSANDAAVALAERAGGSLEGFQPMFAATAASLGLADDPVLNDPAGLDGPDGVEGGNLVSARDLAIAARALLAQPTLAAIVATQVYYFDGPDGVHHRLTNHNKLFLATYPGAIGVKTGYTTRAGVCLISAAQRGGRSMLAVVLNGANPNQLATQLLNGGFAVPVSAESSADRLPPVSGAALVAAGAPVSTPAGTTVPSTAPATTPSPVMAQAVPATKPRPARRSGGVPWLPLSLLAVLAGAVAIGVLRRRSARRRPFRSPVGATLRDRRAA
jgi:D-alanyl-D-alanine carboxypeptidase (penicillin-binding protein 5/6)